MGLSERVLQTIRYHLSKRTSIHVSNGPHKTIEQRRLGVKTMIQIASISCHLYRYKLHTPVQTSFGLMPARMMLLVKVTDKSGLSGLGEVWCNYPAPGGAYRAQLIDQLLSPLLLKKAFETPQAAFQYLTEQTRILALQTGEPGPIAQTIAGIDCAVNDLAARKHGLPLWRYLGGKQDHVKVYASGINPAGALDTIKSAYEQGYRSFKLKVGFAQKTDLENCESIVNFLSGSEQLMVDANQAWSLDMAMLRADQLKPFNLRWLEEPLSADRPLDEWKELASQASMPLAAGENLANADAFNKASRSGSFGVLQPDLAKWGGVSGCLPVARHIIEAGLTFCPHYLGGGVGLIASAHLLSASKGGDMLEVDINHNPLRSLLTQDMLSQRPGYLCLPEKPGSGLDIEQSLNCLEKFKISY